MKQFVDQKNNVVKFGDIIHYSESVNEKDFKSIFDVHVTLVPKNLDKLKAIGAIREVEIEECTIDDYNAKITSILNSKDTKKFIKRFRNCFPAQYLSTLITLIHDDIVNDGETWKDGYIFNLSEGKMVKINIDKSKSYEYINIFPDVDKANFCMKIIKPLVDVMYNK